MEERTVQSRGRHGYHWDWPDTVHLVDVLEVYGVNLKVERVRSKCGRTGRGHPVYSDSPRCKKCFPDEED
jgi:hypothetical protein